MEHIILSKAKRYFEPLHNLKPKDCKYSDEKGYWIENKTNKVMMHSKKSLYLSSKKCDIETGEDQKGE